jgi:hypothetical protein
MCRADVSGDETPDLPAMLIRLWNSLPDQPRPPSCGNCGRALTAHGPAPDFACPPVVTLSDLGISMREFVEQGKSSRVVP